MLFQTRYGTRSSASNRSINQLNSSGKLGEAATAPHLAGHMIWQLCEHMALTFPVKTTVISCQSDKNSPRYTQISVAAICWLSSACGPVTTQVTKVASTENRLYLGQFLAKSHGFCGAQIILGRALSALRNQVMWLWKSAKTHCFLQFYFVEWIIATPH